MITDIPSFEDYLSLKKKIAKLEKRNSYLSHRVSVLSKRLGINHGSKKSKNHKHDRARVFSKRNQRFCRLRFIFGLRVYGSK